MSGARHQLKDASFVLSLDFDELRLNVENHRADHTREIRKNAHIDRPGNPHLGGIHDSTGRQKRHRQKRVRGRLSEIDLKHRTDVGEIGGSLCGSNAIILLVQLSFVCERRRASHRVSKGSTPIGDALSMCTLFGDDQAVACTFVDPYCQQNGADRANCLQPSCSRWVLNERGNVAIGSEQNDQVSDYEQTRSCADFDRVLDEQRPRKLHNANAGTVELR